MSKRIPHSVIRNMWVWVAVLALLPAIAYAATPNARPNRSADTAKTSATTPKPVPPPATPTRTNVRTPASFTREMPFSEAIDILRNCTTPPLPVIVLWRDLDSAGIYRDTPIGIDGIPGLRLGQYLDLLAASLSAGASAKIGYVVDHGVITIATTSALPATRQITRVYDVGDLTAPPANYSSPSMGIGGMGYGGMYGNQMMGLSDGYGGGLGMGYGMGSPSMPGGSGMYGSGGLSGLVGGMYGTGANTAGVSRRR